MEAIDEQDEKNHCSEYVLGWVSFFSMRARRRD